MTNITNPYLSAKAFAKKKTDIPVVLVCAIFAAATVSATIKMFSQGKTLSGVMGIFLFAALITPVFRILRHAYRRACARRIAGALLPLTEESLTFDQLGTVLSSSKALEQLRSLIISCRSCNLVEDVLPGENELFYLFAMPHSYMEDYGDGIVAVLSGGDPYEAFETCQAAVDAQ